MAFCKYMRQVRNAFPDFHNKIEQLVAEGDQVIARLQYTGTHRGEIFGVQPSGKSINYAGVAFFRVAGSRVAEGWVLGDIVSFLRQLGAQTLPNPTN
jgi:predicted ester cyclase